MTHANAAMPDAATARSSGGWEEFRAPGPWNAPAAYWFWHHIPTRSEIVAQIQAMRNAGYQSFQIQTRLSFPRNRYLSDDYLAMCRLAADEAASRGMMIGIYDEYNWLSGWRFRPVTQDADATCSWQPIMPFDGWQAQGIRRSAAPANTASTWRSPTMPCRPTGGSCCCPPPRIRRRCG